MTKEEILNKYGRLVSGPALLAMEEYAKQQAIDYCSWYCSLGYLPKVKDEKDYKPGESYMKSYEELYNEFIESQNKTTNED